MKPWQQYLFTCFKQEEYVEVNIPDLSNMWRFATWDSFVYDTIVCNGTQMATLLSMVYKPKVIVEFGLDAGFTTLQFCRLNPDARIHGVDINSWNLMTNLPIAYHVMMNKVKNLSVHIMSSSDFSMPNQVDLCFIDGDHCGDAPWKDSVRAWENRNTNRDWCIAWDDYHENNPDVYRAVNEFVKMVGMELKKVGSWFYIGTRLECATKEFI